MAVYVWLYMAVDVWMRDTQQDIETFTGVVIFEHLWKVNNFPGVVIVGLLWSGVCLLNGFLASRQWSEYFPWCSNSWTLWSQS